MLPLRYPFNDTAGSAAAIDYSGNGFHATGHANKGQLPAANGTFMRLNNAYEQYLRINSTFGGTLKSLNSFTITTLVKFPKVK